MKRQTKILGNKQILKALAEDNISKFNYNFKQINKLINNCFLRPINETHCADEGEWNTFRSALVQSLAHTTTTTPTTTNTILHSLETYAKIPDNPMTVFKMKSLQSLFDVRIIVFYRRPGEWIRSMYQQTRKKFMYENRAERYREYDDDNTTARLPTLSSFLDHMWDRQNFPPDPNQKTQYSWKADTQNHRDSWKVMEFYEKIFGPDRVRVLNMHANHPLGVELLCNDQAIHAPNACAVFRSMKTNPVANNNSFLLFDEDLFAVEAYSQGYFHPQTNYISRHDATLKLKHLLDSRTKEGGRRRDNLPKQCLTPGQLELLWNRTVWMEKNISPQPVSGEILHKEFQNLERDGKFCELDVKALLNTTKWQTIFSSCAFWRNNDTCTASSNETTAAQYL